MTTKINFKYIKTIQSIKALIIVFSYISICGCSKSDDSVPTVIPVQKGILSRDKTVYTSSGNVNYLTDNKFKAASFTVTNNSWIAINVGGGYSSLFLNWNSPEYSWSGSISNPGTCVTNISYPQNYTIQTSSDSTNGSDGNWTTDITVTDNEVTARGHIINFSGKNWIKMNITKGSGQLDEIEIFNQSDGNKDSWFFPGTSITANTYKGTVPSKNFADLIHEVHSDYYPIMIKGGVPCITSTGFANDINKYLNNASNTKYWAIEMGTNDAWGGTNYNAAIFKENLQTVITACKKSGISPIIARLIATNPTAATWQVHKDFLTAIDELTVSNNLISGPDLYTYFIAHPDELNSDGVHPNATGAASIQRLWAEKMSSLYK